MSFSNDHQDNVATSSSSSSLLSKFGARLRTRTLDGGSATNRVAGDTTQLPSSPPDKVRRPSGTGEGKKRHSYNVLGRKSSSSDLLSGVRSNKPRSASNIFNSLSASFARASVQDNEKEEAQVVRKSSQTGSKDGIYEGSVATRKASSSNEDDGQGYQWDNGSDSPPNLEHHDDIFDIHYTSASAYDSQPAYAPSTSGEETDGSRKAVVTTEGGGGGGGGELSPKRKRRLSVSLLSQRWSRADLAGHAADEQSAIGSTQEPNNGSFNLRSFRNVRHASDMSVERRLERTDSDLTSANYAAMTDVQRHSYATSTGARTPPSVVHQESSVKSLQTRSRTASTSHGSGSMPAGMFIRAAARSRIDVQSIANDGEDDNRGTRGNVAMGSPVLQQTGSPYRPLTPLGQGAQSPAEELAILEADLAKARRNSLAYLAQLEEKELLRQRRRMQRAESRRDSITTNSETPLSYSPGSSPPTSYFAPAYQHREILPQTSSLFEKLQQLEGQQARAIDR